MLCPPRLNTDVLNVAEPLLSATGEPRLLPPSLNCTVPVGVPDPGGTADTVTVKVTDWPKTEGLLFEVTTVKLLAWLIVCVGSEPVLPVKFVSPLYTAVMLCVPGDKDEVARVAVPLLNVTGAPRLLPPSLNCTVPVAVPGVTVAVKVTDWPKTEGLLFEVTVVEVLVWLTVCVGNEAVLPIKLVSPL